MKNRKNKKEDNSEIKRMITIWGVVFALLISFFIMKYFFEYFENNSSNLESVKIENELLRQRQKQNNIYDKSKVPVQEEVITKQKEAVTPSKKTNTIQTINCVTFFNTKVQVTKEECDYIEKLNKQSQISQEKFDKCREKMNDIKDECYEKALDNLSESDIEDCAKEAKNRDEECVEEHANTIEKLWKN